MQTLDLECPSCGEMLELDAGFAGGVCRCSSCGTLMTVPADAGQAEALSRPGEGAGYDSGVSSMGRPDPGRRRTSAKKDKASNKRKSKSKSQTKSKTKSKGKAAQETSTIEAGEYRTSSGKVVKVEKTARVPMAQSKKKQIRAATTIVFFGIVFSIVLVAAIVIAVVVSQGRGPSDGWDGPIAYDQSANPYDLGIANVAGLPLSDRTVIVVEASEYSEDWMGSFADVLGNGLSHKPGKRLDAETAVIGATSSGPQAFLNGGPADPPLDRNALIGFLNSLPQDGTADMTQAIKLALGLNPDTLILVLGDADDREVQDWSAMVGSGGPTVHAVMIDQSPIALREWVTGRKGGQALQVGANDFETWKDFADSSSE